MGKTTLARVVYDKLLAKDEKFSCKAFVPVGRNPDLKKVFRDILIELNKSQYMDKTNFLMILDERQLIEEIQGFLKHQRYLIVIDDVWDVTSWNMIRTALWNNNIGSKIIITTRNSDVAGLVQRTYKIRPLPPESSKTLFYGRTFGSQERCPERFSELSDKILKKCGGVPLAIITIASLLANKSSHIIDEWQEVCNSIGSGLNNSNDVRKILSLSYYDLPSHMKKCFLYLSMYPEDYVINRDQLIWRLICEGFIQPLRKGDDLFELGKCYFNDLINRSLIQPVVGIDENNDEIYGCLVHDMILDLICYLSREENLVTTSDDIDKVMSSESKKFRRLSLRCTDTWPGTDVSRVRSIVVFGSSFGSVPSFSSLGMLRVLDLEGCSLADDGGSNNLCIGKLVHLRYLWLRGTGLEVLPEGIEKLQFLQVLKMDGDIRLPKSIFGLRRLMCLEGVLCCPQQGNLLKNLASLQVLDQLCLKNDEDPTSTLKALGHLTRLTKLTIEMKLGMMDQIICDTFIDSLGNLSRLEYLRIPHNTGHISYERWTPPPHLRYLCCFDSRMFPKWINLPMLPHLTHLSIFVRTVQPDNIQILGTLPKLVWLQLGASIGRNYLDQPLQKFMVSSDAFPCLRFCNFYNVVAVPSMFTRGAMPRVQEFCFTIRARDFFSDHGQGGLDFDDLSMDHLLSLWDVTCTIIMDVEIDEEDMKELRAAVKHAADVHPNHPNISINAVDSTMWTY